MSDGSRAPLPLFLPPPPASLDMGWAERRSMNVADFTVMGSHRLLVHRQSWWNHPTSVVYSADLTPLWAPASGDVALPKALAGAVEWREICREDYAPRKPPPPHAPPPPPPPPRLRRVLSLGGGRALVLRYLFQSDVHFDWDQCSVQICDVNEPPPRPAAAGSKRPPVPVTVAAYAEGDGASVRMGLPVVHAVDTITHPTAADVLGEGRFVTVDCGLRVGMASVWCGRTGARLAMFGPVPHTRCCVVQRSPLTLRFAGEAVRAVHRDAPKAWRYERWTCGDDGASAGVSTAWRLVAHTWHDLSVVVNLPPASLIFLPDFLTPSQAAAPGAPGALAAAPPSAAVAPIGASPAPPPALEGEAAVHWTVRDPYTGTPLASLGVPGAWPARSDGALFSTGRNSWVSAKAAGAVRSRLRFAPIGYDDTTRTLLASRDERDVVYVPEAPVNVVMLASNAVCLPDGASLFMGWVDSGKTSVFAFHGLDRSPRSIAAGGGDGKGGGAVAAGNVGAGPLSSCREVGAAAAAAVSAGSGVAPPRRGIIGSDEGSRSLYEGPSVAWHYPLPADLWYGCLSSFLFVPAPPSTALRFGAFVAEATADGWREALPPAVVGVIVQYWLF